MYYICSIFPSSLAVLSSTLLLAEATIKFLKEDHNKVGHFGISTYLTQREKYLAILRRLFLSDGENRYLFSFHIKMGLCIQVSNHQLIYTESE